MEEEIKLSPIKTAILNLSSNFNSLGVEINDFLDKVNKRFENIEENQKNLKEGLEQIKDLEKRSQLKQIIEKVDRYKDSWVDIKYRLFSLATSSKFFSDELSERYKKLFGETY